MSIYDMAVKYYPERWDKARLQTLVKSGLLTEEEYKTITGEEYPSEG